MRLHRLARLVRACIAGAALAAVGCAWCGEIGGPEDRDPLPPVSPTPAEHPLRELVEYLASPAARRQPPWKRTLAELALNHRPRYAKVTAFCRNCGGGATRWGTKTRPGIAAADPAYWGPGSVIWVGPPVDHILIVEDIGGAVQGRDRFDVCISDDCRICREIGGRSNVVYVELHRQPPRTRWGRRPAKWEPPVPFDLARIAPRPRIPASG